MINSKIEPISTAPRDGTEIMGIYDDNEEVEIRWSETRRCMMAGSAGGHGYFGAGWEDTYNKLIVDEPKFWRKIL